mgnify:CR=1 FL=1
MEIPCAAGIDGVSSGSRAIGEWFADADGFPESAGRTVSVGYQFGCQPGSSLCGIAIGSDGRCGIGYVASAIIGVLKYFSVEEDIRAYVIWGLGSFARVSGDQMILFVCIMAVLLPLSFLLIKTMNLLLLGDGYARSLGLNIKRARLLVGASLALVCNLIARMPGFEGALPVNSVTALVGAPVVASVLFRKRKGELEE